MSLRAGGVSSYLACLLLVGLIQPVSLAQLPNRPRTFPLEDLEGRVSVLTGPNRAECGRYVWKGQTGPLASPEDLESSIECALASAAAKVPFWFVTAGPGFDSWVANGLLGNQKGELLHFHYDANSFGSGNTPTFEVKPCTSPKVKVYEQGYANFECQDPQTLARSIGSYASIVWDDFMSLVKRVVLR